MKVLTMLLSVIAGIGAALAVFWLLNKIAELLPGKWEERIKPLLYILPAFAAVALYLIYPTIVTVINSFEDRHLDVLGGPAELQGPAHARTRSSRRCSTPCSGSSSSRR